MPRTVIVGIGNLSTQFTEKLVEALVDGPKGHGIVAVGVYDNGSGVAGTKVRKNIHRRTRKLHVDDISVTPREDVQDGDPKHDDLVTLREHIQDYRPDTLLLIVDSEFMRQENYVEVFRVLKVRAVQLSITVICFTEDTIDDQSAYALLERRTGRDPLIDAPIFEAAFIVRSDAPMVASFGGLDVQNEVIAKSLAGIWTAPLHRNFNPEFATQVGTVRQREKTFIGLAAKSQGITMIKPQRGLRRLFYPLLRHSTRYISREYAAETIANLTRTIVNDLPPVTTVTPFGGLGIDVHVLPISINFIVPFRPNTSKFDDIANLVQLKLKRTGSLRTQEEIIKAQPESGASARDLTLENGAADHGYNVVMRSIVRSKGINLSARIAGTVKVVKDKYYCQVCVLFAISSSQISFPKLRDRAEG